VSEHLAKLQARSDNWPRFICKSILLQYNFFCIVPDAYSHTVGILVWTLCISLVIELNNAEITVSSFSTTVLSGWVLHESLLHLGLKHGNIWTLMFHKEMHVATCLLSCGGRVKEDFVANLLVNPSAKISQYLAKIWARL